jgi:hypothetical protein
VAGAYRNAPSRIIWLIDDRARSLVECRVLLYFQTPLVLVGPAMEVAFGTGTAWNGRQQQHQERQQQDWSAQVLGGKRLSAKVQYKPFSGSSIAGPGV